MISLKAVLVLKLREKGKGQAAVLTREWPVPAAPQRGDRLFCPFIEGATPDADGVGAEVVLVRWDMPKTEGDPVEVLAYITGSTYHDETEWLDDVGLWKRAGFDAEFGELKDD